MHVGAEALLPGAALPFPPRCRDSPTKRPVKISRLSPECMETMKRVLNVRLPERLNRRIGRRERIGKVEKIRSQSPRYVRMGNVRNERFGGEPRFAPLFLLPRNGILNEERHSKNGNLANSCASALPGGLNGSGT